MQAPCGRLQARCSPSAGCKRGCQEHYQALQCTPVKPSRRLDNHDLCIVKEVRWLQRSACVMQDMRLVYSHGA